MAKYVLGLDVGIASVGWGVIELESGKIIDCGVRLFSEGTAANNIERRAFRSGRRLVRRRQQRIIDAKDILKKYDFYDDNFQYSKNIYELRVNALKNKVSKNEFANCVLHICKKRGLVDDNIIPEDETKISEKETTKKSLTQNQKELKEKNYFVSQLQLERLKNGKLKGQENIFSTADYIKELEQICETNKISLDLKKQLIELLKRKRKYYEGPGSKFSPTPYGRYLTYGSEPIDLIEKMRGKCSIYENELRAPKKAYSVEMFNFLQDLNNLKFNGDETITTEQKNQLIKDYIEVNGNITPNQLAKFLNVSLEEIRGFRINKKGEPQLTKFDGYKIFLNLIKNGFLSSKSIENKEILDQIAEILTSKKSEDERCEQIKKIVNVESFLNENEIRTISSLGGFNEYHSLSFRAIYEFLPELLETNYNQMQIMSLNNYKTMNKKVFYGNKIPSNIDDVLSPVVKRSQNEAIKIVNAVRKKYGELDSIVIEMPRDKNSFERKKRINEFQKNNELLNKQVVEEINKVYNGKISFELKQKVRLYLEQEGKCLYSRKTINLKDLISNHQYYEIDHIIPLSISLDDSFNNKCLVYREENQKKGQRTPYQYFKMESNYEEYKNYILELSSSKKISYKKVKNLLNESDVNKYENQKEFINRNLVDTQYSSRNILNLLSEYYKENNIDTKVYTIKGLITNIFRKKSNLVKNRDDDYSHHAVDALIIAGIKKMKMFDNLINISNYKKEDINIKFDSITGEIIDDNNKEQFFDQNYIDFINSLKEIKPKYSHKVDKKYNRSISNQTIYSTKIHFETDEEYIIGKKNIYDDPTVAKWFKEDNRKKLEKLLMYKNDINTFNKLVDICKNYNYAENPFLEYYLKNKVYITKYSKKDKKNSPIIKDVRYYDNKLGNHLNISKNYNTNNKVVLLSLNPYRIDLYQRDNGDYDFIQIYQHHIKKQKNKIFIQKNIYDDLLKEKKLDENAKFLYSVYKNEPLLIEPFKPEFSKDGIVLYSGVKNLDNCFIYIRSIFTSKIIVNGQEIKQPYLNIKKAIQVKKLSTDVLGNIFTLPFEDKPKLILNES